VASQTVVNMNTIDNAVNMLILRPLCGMDKLATIDIARKIGTFDLSAEQVPDSCTVFAPDKPSTRVPIADAEAEEARIPGYYEIIEKIVNEIEL
jgi:thiamine biosynthesis protein ThiI